MSYSIGKLDRQVEAMRQQGAGILNEVRLARVDAELTTITLAAITEAREAAMRVAEGLEQYVHGHIERVVTRCLQDVFEEDYKFKLTFVRKRGRTEAQFAIIHDGILLEEPKDETGGGVMDVAAFAVRVACLCLHTPPRRMLLVLDEPFKHVATENIPRIRNLILALSQELGVQFIIITHHSDLQVGQIIELGR